MNIVMMGAQGTGKGTVAGILKDELNIPHISTGEIFRQNIKEETELGKIAKQYADEHNILGGYRLKQFIDGAQWQKEQMIKDAVESRVTITSGGLLFDDLHIEDVDYADKVKIIIIKDVIL